MSSSLPCLAQNYRTTDPLLIQPCPLSGDSGSRGTAIELPANTLIRVLPSSITDGKVIKVFEFTGGGSEQLNKDYVYNSNSSGKSIKTSPKYFFISNAMMEYTVLVEDVKRSSGFVFGPLIVPIKMRFGSFRGDPKERRTYFDLTADVNLGLAAGHKWAFVRKGNNRPFELAALGGVSITSITMNADNTQNFLTNENKISALTLTAAGVFIKDQFQIGVMVGMDFPSGEVGKKWIYRDMPWVGIGLGVTLFQNNNDRTMAVQAKNKTP